MPAGLSSDGHAGAHTQRHTSLMQIVAGEYVPLLSRSGKEIQARSGHQPRPVQEGVAADGLDQQHRRKTQHGEAAVDPLGVAAPAEGRHIAGGGAGGLHRGLSSAAGCGGSGGSGIVAR